MKPGKDDHAPESVKKSDRFVHDSAPVLIVAGPTASGKSGLAIAAAQAFNGVIVNADSMQVYRELKVLTARPRPGTEALAPHRLYGVMSVRESCSAGRWCRLALNEIGAAHATGKLPIVTGGTGLYLKALVDGIAELPEIPPALRARARELFDELGPVEFRAALAARHASAEVRPLPRDRQRLIRAWEVLEATGRSLADWQGATPDARPTHLRFAAVRLDPPREALYEAIEHRLDRMIEEGAVDEVKALLAMKLDPQMPALKAVGIAELAEYLEGRTSLEEALANAKQSTRRLAKRQNTWFRHQPLADRVLSIDEPAFAQFSESFKDRIFNFIRRSLLTESN
ncbi:MAG TPA: tRNA (adenosine(37)-N6)-dimethylallyltransferase MiaA [Alphaproteobacteria bacterium]|nr:tRNA (adenosine(37)-N6)-dimethylallyltransferase MiaA [Alphaproteobacteria bacterium]